MSIIRKLLVLIIIIIFSFIIYNLLQKRRIILNNTKNTEDKFEGFSIFGSKDINDEPSSAMSSIKKIMIDNNDPLYTVSIADLSKHSQYLSIPLNQFCIKGSMNSSLVNGYISINMVKYVLSRGCRFLDFELYYLKDPSNNYNAYVGYNPDNTAVNPTNANIMRFDIILKSIFQYAFSKQFWNSPDGNTYLCPNINDPLFIQIRLKTGNTDKIRLYNEINKYINLIYCDMTYRDNFYVCDTSPTSKINNNTNISKLLGKVVFVFEYDDEIKNMNNNFYKNILKIDKTKCLDGEDGYLGSIVVNNGSLEEVFYSNININKYVANRPEIIDTYLTDVKKWNIVYPDRNTKSQPNVNVYNSIGQYGYQINMLQYNICDINLKNSENIFNTYKSSFIPLSVIFRFIDYNIVLS
jgi:hypothetical protein